MKRIEQFRKMNTRELANEFFYFDYEDFMKDGDNYDGVGCSDGCKDISCGTYAAYEIYKLIEKEK